MLVEALVVDLSLDREDTGLFAEAAVGGILVDILEIAADEVLPDSEQDSKLVVAGKFAEVGNIVDFEVD